MYAAQILYTILIALLRMLARIWMPDFNVLRLASKINKNKKHVIHTMLEKQYFPLQIIETVLNSADCN
jgi:hypothetical protein